MKCVAQHQHAAVDALGAGTRRLTPASSRVEKSDELTGPVWLLPFHPYQRFIVGTIVLELSSLPLPLLSFHHGVLILGFPIVS